MTYSNPGRRRLCAIMTCLLLVEAAGPALTGQPPRPMGEFNPHAAQPAQQPGAAQPPGAPGAAPPTNGPVINGVIQFGGFTLQNASLTEVVDTLARQLKINYILPKAFGGSVTLNTYGDTKNIDARKLLDLILRINGYGMVQTGDVYRIVPLSDISHQPLRPEKLEHGQVNDEDSPMLNLVFLKYITADELAKVISSFQGEGAQIITYQPANLMMILDSRRNMKRTMELIGLFDDNTLANQRVHSFDIKNSKPSDLAKELDGIFKSISMNPGDKGSPIKFVPVDRINVLLAVAPNPGAFELVGQWIKKLDTPAEIIKGARENYVYRVKYAQAQILAMVIYALYTGQNPFGGGMGGGYGGYGASGFGGGMGTGYGAGGMGTGMGGYGSTGYGSGGSYGMGGNGMGSYGNGYGGAGAFNTAGFGGVNAGGYAAYSGAGIPTGAGMASAGATLPSAGATGTLGGTINPNGIGSTGTYLGEGTAGGQVNPNLPHIIPNPMDNTLLIQATPSDYKSIEKLLGEIDVPPRQVLIDAKIYEIDLSGALSVGVETYLQQVGSASSTGTTTPGTQQANTHQFLASLVSGAASLSVGTYVGKSRELLGFVQFEETQSKAKTISSPSIIATDSIPASINVGTSLPTISSQAVQSGVQVGGTNPYAETIQNVDTGIQLNVLARVTPAGIVTMVINQDVSAPTGGSAGSLTPSFQKRNVSTQVTIQDGDTIALGGAIQETVTESTNGIPFLDRIPGLSWLFSQKSYSKARTELIVFLTPHVLYDTNSVADASDELRDKMKLLQRIIRDDKDQ
jgi:general secretion pathway protein D